MRKSIYLVILAIVLISTFSIFVSASFQLGNLSESITTSYSAGSSLEGWINISLSNEKKNSKLSSSFEGEINSGEIKDQ